MPASPVDQAVSPKVTIPSGTTLGIRLVDSIDSETAQPGQVFHATLDSPLAVDGDTAIPSGYSVEGHIVDVKSAGKFAGQSLLVLQLDRIAVGSKNYNLQTDQYKRQGNSRGKNTAKKVGAGPLSEPLSRNRGWRKRCRDRRASRRWRGGRSAGGHQGQQIKLPSETLLTLPYKNL